MHKVSTKTRLVNTLALAIAAAPPAMNVKTYLLDQHGNFAGFSEATMMDYTGFDFSGHFEWSRAIKGWGPILAAIALKKAMSKIKAGKLII